MRRPGTDENNVQPSDVLCDFCRTPWAVDRPVIEGHHGSVLCGDCLTLAYRGIVLREAPTSPAGYSCTMCLEKRDEPGWAGPMYPEANVCRRCVKMAAAVLHKDKDYAWEKPTQ
jgi:hypothetical protein